VSGELRIAARAVLGVLVAGGVGVGPLFALTKCNDAVTPPTCYYDRLITATAATTSSATAGASRAARWRSG